MVATDAASGSLRMRYSLSFGGSSGTKEYSPYIGNTEYLFMQNVQRRLPTEEELATEQGELAVDQDALRLAAAEAAVMQMAELAEHLPLAPPALEPVHDHARLPEEGIDLRGHLDAIERRLIEQALQRSDGIVAHAARLLGLRRTTLVEKLRKFSLVVTETDATES